MTDSIVKHCDSYQVLINGQWITVSHSEAVNLYAKLASILIPRSIEIVQKVSDRLKIPVAEIMGTSHHSEVVFARHVTWYVMREVYKMSFPSIARDFKRDSSTPQHACNRIFDYIYTKSQKGKIVTDLCEELKKEI